MKICIIVTSVFYTLVFSSCEKPDLSVPNSQETIKYDIRKIYQNSLEAHNYIIVGDTLLNNQVTKLPALPEGEVSLTSLKNNLDPDLADKLLHFVTIGGSLTAGVRDGGYFNDGILTSYPNLIARQMKLKEFRQPLFSKDEYNGYGLKLPSSFNPTEGPVLKYAAVKNNLAIASEASKEVVLSAFKVEIDNWGIPRITRQGLIGKGRYVEIKPNFEPFINRLNALSQLNELTGFKELHPLIKIKNTKIDFYILETGFDDILEYALSGGESRIFNSWNGDSSNRPWEDTGYDSAPLQITRAMYKKGVKGCIATIPDVLDLPYFQFPDISWKKEYKDTFRPINFIYDLLIPTSTVDSLLSKKVNNLVRGLHPRNELIEKERLDIKSMTNDYNKEYYALAKKFNLAVVDLNALYKKIIAGQYSEQGVLIDPSFLKGNFFSSDGITPTALGQAVIANEFIRTINSFYKTAIPFISIREL